MRTGNTVLGGKRGACASVVGRAVACLAALGLLVWHPGASADGNDEPPFVVMLYPEASDGSPGNALTDRGIRAAFSSGGIGRIEVHNEYLNLSRFTDETYQDDLAKFLSRKYAGRKVNLVIAGLSSGLDFALKYRDEIFPDAPIVFCAVDAQEVAKRDLPADVIGVPIRMDLSGSLEAALATRPGTRNVFVIAGQSSFDSFWEAEARRQFQPFTGKVELHYLSGLPMDELLERVATLPEHSVLYYLHVFQDGDGQGRMPAEVLRMISQRANAPVYSHVDSYLGNGIVGGRVFRFERAGADAAALGLRILGGERPERIGITAPSENSYVFDWRQLQRFKISEASLPPGSEVRFKTPGVWDLYKWHILSLAAVFVLQSLLIVGLLVQRSRRAQAERRFQQVVDAAPTGMLMVGPAGEMLLANAQMEVLFGYRRDEFLGQPFEMLLAPEDREEHQALRRVFFLAPTARPRSAGRPLSGRRKDGSQFPIEIGLSPLPTTGRTVALASIVDISQRRAAEQGLRASQEKLRELTGKLLGAQESERRRIARELHDDFGQSLALLSVELDLLLQQPNPGPAHFGSRIETLSLQVKQLSSSVHDLSHQLHPLKLEQLGLVAALRGLCQELSESHGLKIDFVFEEIPSAIPPDAAICLYRIAQEGLRNVIKHSGARRATVRLSCGEKALCLQIGDDGAGFDPSAAADGTGLGLASMRERIRLVDGEIVIRGQAGEGTQVEARVPLFSGHRAALESPHGTLA